ncbi:MAG: PD-(D/E)XK nuclease domain-containing protein, partial [Muribaculaceae bacterium]|nr:PD-(D/E)XK nuclease domain-containing protein [Muribaculaceae bacterium]
MMAIVAKMLGLKVITEVHSAAGRCDMQILTDRFVYIFEFKINGSTEEALQQIIERDYAAPFAAGSQTVFLIATNFSTKQRNLTEWIIQKV